MLLLAVLAVILVGACIIYGAEHWTRHDPPNEDEQSDGADAPSQTQDTVDTQPDAAQEEKKDNGQD